MAAKVTLNFVSPPSGFSTSCYSAGLKKDKRKQLKKNKVGCVFVSSVGDATMHWSEC